MGGGGGLVVKITLNTDTFSVFPALQKESKA